MKTVSVAEPSGSPSADDLALMKTVNAGVVGAFELVVDRYQQRVTRLAQRMLGTDAEDVTQDVFVTVLEKAGRFRGDCSLWTWLTRITLNQCRNRLRRKQIRRKFESWFRSERTSAASDARAAASDQATQVRHAIETLPIRDREVIVLAYLEGRSATEIAELSAQSLNSVEVRLSRARAKLREILIERDLTP